MRVAPQQSENKFPVSVENARQLLVRALEVGRIHVTEHFKQRGLERNFNSLDAERVIRHGEVVRGPEYCSKFRNWRFSISGVSCARTLEVCVGLTLDLDLEYPVLALITGVPKRRRSICKSQKPVPTRRL